MNYFFCGIGGIGMSSIAKLLAFKGHQVSGSDRGFDKGENLSMKKALESAGIMLYPQDGSGVTAHTQMLVISTAVEPHIPDVQKALSLQIPIRKRAEVLAEIFETYEGIAVGGTSGKTTITAMIGHILHEAGLDPTVIDGGILLNSYGKEPSNLILGKGTVCVIEADESDGTIELYHPAVAVISNISLDHKPLAELHQLFQHFAQKATQGVVVNAACPHCQALLKIHPNTVTFSSQDHIPADFQARELTQTSDGIHFKVGNLPGFLAVPGRHNVEDALAAIGAVSLMGVSLEKALDALKSFKGTKRRLEKIGVQNKITVIDDYAHNPEKVAATLSTLTQPETPFRLWAVFQPHGYAPTRLMRSELVQAFSTHASAQDVLIFPEIYYQGGTVAKDISSKDLVADLKKYHKEAYYFEHRSDIVSFIASRAAPGDRVVVMGARDASLTDLAKAILAEIGANK